LYKAKQVRIEQQRGAWEFIRLILSAEWLRQNTEYTNFPTNKIVFDETIARARAGKVTVYWAGVTQFPGHMTQEASAFVDKTLALIDSAEGLSSRFDPLLDIIIKLAARVLSTQSKTYMELHKPLRGFFCKSLFCQLKLP